MVKAELPMAANNIYAIFKAVGKFTAKPRIYEHIFDGIRAKGRLSATGCFVVNDLRGQMNYNAIEEPTPGRNASLVANAARNS